MRYLVITLDYTALTYVTNLVLCATKNSLFCLIFDNSCVSQ